MEGSVDALMNPAEPLVVKGAALLMNPAQPLDESGSAVGNNSFDGELGDR